MNRLENKVILVTGSTTGIGAAMARRFVAEGADILDVGGESTRPGAVRIDADVEIARVVPVVKGLAAQGLTVSIDTMHAAVARAALGARIGARADPRSRQRNDDLVLGEDHPATDVAARAIHGLARCLPHQRARCSVDDMDVATDGKRDNFLAGDLADTPAAYSVITREFIDALNLTDLNGAIEWTVNTNVNNDNGANLTFASNVTYTTRGTGASTPQRNFFPFYLNFDSYNLDRYDFSRGPNSVLFGNGNQAGSANVVTKQARFDKPVRELRTSFGSWNTRRVHTGIEVEDTAVASLRFPDGGLGTIEATTAAFPGWARRIELCGENGSVVLEDDRIRRWDFRTAQPEDAAILAAKPDDTMRSGAGAPGAMSHLGHQRQIENFVAAIRNGAVLDVNGASYLR